MLDACGALAAYNKLALAPVARHNKCKRPLIRCADPGNPDVSKATVECRSGRCVAH
jgi:hypothetical protein